jgi:pyruvate dehydrogenase E2 component (dihydrolipoamide acetyltransferase)
MTDLLALRQQLRAQDLAYTFNDFILKSVAFTLTEFPLLNSTTDGKQVWRHRRIDLGLAVSLEQGLVVPVLRNADGLSLQEIHYQASDLVARARGGKLKPTEMAGSTFTISNMGMLDVENFTAIINPGESAVLAVSSITEQAVVRNGQIVIQDLMKITLSCDHRLIDGALAARFINAVKRRLEETSLWKSLM